jgi:guanylate kinase
MTFYPERPLVLVNYRQAEKEGKMYNFVTMADTETYENQTFMLARDQSVDNLRAKNKYRVALEVEGKFSTVMLLPPEAPDKKPA